MAQTPCGDYPDDAEVCKVVNLDTVVSLGIWASGVGMSAVGIEMTINPPGEKRWLKWLYRAIFIALGLVFIGFSLWQSDRSEREQKREADNHTQEQIRNEGNQKYVEGQLDNMTKVLHELSMNSAPGPWLAALKAALPKIPYSGGVSSAPPVAPAVTSAGIPNPYMNMTPAQLGVKADMVINQFSRMSAAFTQNIANVDKQAPSSYPSKEAEMMDKKARFQTKQELYRSMVVSCRNSRSDTILLVQAMLAKTGAQSPPEPGCLAGGIVNFPKDLQAVSDYLRTIRNDL